MTYDQTLDFLFNQLANYHKSGGEAYKPGLDRINNFLEAIGNPHKQLNCIHVAGTNGKGSVTHMLSSVFQEAGHRVGLFTSPHLIDFRERFKLNGQLIPEKYVLDFVKAHKDQAYCEGISFFEWCTALAFDYFNKSNVDIAIIETGLGGRLDATNVIDSEICAITNISMDHQSFLGDTIEDIAKEKAGIIKPKAHVFLGEMTAQLIQVFDEVSEKKQATLHLSFNQHDLETDLKGTFQNKNLDLVYEITQFWMSEERIPHLSKEAVVGGLKCVVDNTKLLGRWQSIQNTPEVICDTGHNLKAFEMIVSELNKTDKDVHMILGMAKDKDHEAILSILPKSWNYYFPRFDSIRLMKPEDIKEIALGHELNVCLYGDLMQTYNTVLSQVSNENLVFIGGSNFVVAEFLEKK